MACLLVAGPLNEKNLAVKLRQNPKKTVSSLPVFMACTGTISNKIKRTLTWDIPMPVSVLFFLYFHDAVRRLPRV